MPNMDKIFCSKWLSHRQVVFGTKCNKLMVFDVNTRHMDQIPSLASSENSSPPEAECGIHAIEINPSKTLLATGGRCVLFSSGVAEGVRYWGCYPFFLVGPTFNPKILRVLKAYILPILRNIGGAVAPPVPSPLLIQYN